MSRYIDADALRLVVFNHANRQYCKGNDDEEKAFIHCLYLIDCMPTADVVEVVRCKDCKHYSADGWGFGNCYRTNVDYLRMADDSFCSYGERREDDN